MVGVPTAEETADREKVAELARAAATVHASAAALAYADIFPPTSPAPTADDLAPLWHTMLDDPAATVVVARIGNDVVGAVAVGPDPDVPTGLVMAKLYVHPDRWGDGVGAALHDEALRLIGAPARSINLWVLERNHRARAFYEQRGWRHVPERFLANDPPDVLDVLYQLGPDRGR